MTMCQCEHAEHYDEMYPSGGKPRSCHPSLSVPAGDARAHYVGPICDHCATGHLSEYVIKPDATAQALIDHDTERDCGDLEYVMARINPPRNVFVILWADGTRSLHATADDIQAAFLWDFWTTESSMIPVKISHITQLINGRVAQRHEFS